MFGSDVNPKHRGELRQPQTVGALLRPVHSKLKTGDARVGIERLDKEVGGV